MDRAAQLIGWFRPVGKRAAGINFHSNPETSFPYLGPRASYYDVA